MLHGTASSGSAARERPQNGTTPMYGAYASPVSRVWEVDPLLPPETVGGPNSGGHGSLGALPAPELGWNTGSA